MTFTRGTQKEKNIFKIDGVDLENTKEYKYLGIMINKKNCTFSPAIKAIGGGQSKILGFFPKLTYVIAPCL